MIATFANKETQQISVGEHVKRWPLNVCKIAQRKLAQLEVSQVLGDLNCPPGNRLEALKGDRKGQWSIRINDQWRVCFVWKGDTAYDVEIVDYH